ncbi:purine nucleosidase [Hathewaya proteolytica DSM 3090]|uniref:Purine nucleosidase n=1 Tax=Hathewaya proteolytica DSM 3090 TaxID=1121331 RepID=A0A1M6KHH5_9CLOT|nr:nucleoside hydrolase [Hathewaya proteolytica]SHJ58367.1 purine nucleosidase [Hathewaya proteolytica DSM 3090]
MSRKIIIDCDNTFAIDGCDIDDGHAIIYTLAQENVEVLGINTTFGNHKISLVYPNTIKFMKDIGCSNIPVYKGAKYFHKNNEAAKFLVKMANLYKGELSLIVTGSLTNLYHAWQIDNSFYDKIESIVLMGGITEPLIINTKLLNELNFSCNHKAALNVMEHGRNLIIATGNTCLSCFFTIERFEKLKDGSKFEKWLYHESVYWFEREKKVYKNKGIYIWDIIAAAAMLNPQLFIEENVEISPDKKSIKKGMLIGKGEKRKVIIPKIKNADEFIEHVYEQYKKFGEKF